MGPFTCDGMEYVTRTGQPILKTMNLGTLATLRARGAASAHGRQVFWTCAALSLALHGLILAMHMPTASPPASLGPAGPFSMQARLVTAPVAPQPGATATNAEAPGAAVVAVPARAAKPQDLQDRIDRVAVAASPTIPAPAAQPSLAPALVPLGGFGVPDDYLPRPLLTVGPVPQAPIVLRTPQDDPDAMLRTGLLSLFIDEEGTVRRVEAEQPQLPEALEEAAREAFMAARFSAGEVNGRPVKSRLRVEVTFGGLSPEAPR